MFFAELVKIKGDFTKSSSMDLLDGLEHNLGIHRFSPDRKRS